MKKLSLTLMLLLVACKSVGPDYLRTDVKLPEKYSENELSNSADKDILKQWWMHYQDPKLNELVEKTLQNNTSVAAALARIDEADANLREIGGSLYPQINLSAAASRSKVTEFGSFPTFGGAERNHFQFGLNTSYEIDFWGKIKRAKEASSAAALGSRYAKDTIELSLLGLVSSNYLQLRGLEAQIAVAKDNQKSRNESLALTKRRLSGGVASSLEVNQAEVAVTNLDAQLIELTRLRALTLHQLAVLTGELDLQLEPGDLRNLPLPPSPPAGIPSSLLENRPDVREAEQLLIAQNANIGIAKAALYPSISLTGNLGMESALLKNLFKSGSSVWGLGLGLDLPIFDSGKRQSRVDQADAKQKQSLSQYQAAIQNEFIEVNDALTNRRLNAEREQALKLSETSAKNAQTIAENRYKAGYSAYLDVLDAQRVYNDAASAAIQAKQATFLSTVELFKALGGDWRGSKMTETSPVQP